MNAVLEINSKLKDQLDHLAAETHRSETDLANEAVTIYLSQQRKILERIQEGLAQARRGEFVHDDEMEEFFANHCQAAE